jgi:hypothetical protein
MLKSTIQAPLVGSIVSGSISPAVAQGYLPQYRGSAAASLAPAMLNVETSPPKLKVAKDSGYGSFCFSAENAMSEMQTVQGQYQKATTGSVEGLGAENFERFIKKQDDMNKKLVGQGWTTETTGKGPVNGSDW